jgi:hypothetical protein
VSSNSLDRLVSDPSPRPRRIDQLRSFPDHGTRQAIMKLTLPARISPGPKAAMVDSILGSPRTPTTRPSFDGNVQPAAIAAQQAGRRYPGINLVRDQPVTRCRSTRTGQPSPGSCGVLTPKCHRRCVPPCRRSTRETSGHTRGQAFGIGPSVMASPLLEIKPSPIGLSTPLTGPDLRRH